MTSPLRNNNVGQSKILELAIRVSVGRFIGGENIHPLMLSVVDLLLGNHGGRDKKPTILFSWLLGVLQIQTVGGGGLGQRALFKAGGNIVCVYSMLLQLNPRVRGEHPTT